jgi:hypothetical protein
MTAVRKPRPRRLLIAGTLLLLGAAFAVPPFLEQPYLDENRTLAPPPTPPNGPAELDVFRQAVDAYVADHFPPRALLIAGLNRLRLAIGSSGSPRVIAGKNGWLFADNGVHLGAARGTDKLDPAAMRAWLAGLAGRSEALQSQGAAYVVLLAPDKEEIYPDQAPAWFQLDPDRNAMRFARLAAASQAGDVIYPAPQLAKQAAWGLKVYEPTETHWTGLGAYQGYVALMRTLQARGLTDGPRPIEAFSEPADTPARPRNLALMLGVAGLVKTEFPQLADPATEARLKITYLTAKQDWTAPQLIETGEVGKPTLLLVRDSFATALLPFLYAHFSRIVLAHNQDGFWRQDLIDRFHPNVVVTEVIASGSRFVMSGSPPASPEAQTRIAAAVARASARRNAPSAPAPIPGKVMVGGPTDDLLEGGPGPDRIFGGPGNDLIKGFAGPDVLRGGKGNDDIRAGSGDDWLSGDRGDDTLSGQRGADTFHLGPNADLDLVLDFNPAEGDKVRYDRGLAVTVRQVGADTVIEAPGGRMVLKGVRAAGLPPGAIGPG